MRGVSLVHYPMLALARHLSSGVAASGNLAEPSGGVNHDAGAVV